MINKKSFVKIMNSFDEFWNDKNEHLKALGIYESYFSLFADVVLEALDADVDPEHNARYDELTMDCGSFISEWLFGKGAFQEKCPNAEALYDYIMAAQDQPTVKE